MDQRNCPAGRYCTGKAFPGHAAHSVPEKLNKLEIRQAAKEMVAHSGPFNVLEFGEELFWQSCPPGDPRAAHAAEITEEAQRQAVRVLDFLGL